MQVICPPAPAPVKEDKPLKMDKPDKFYGGRRLAGMEGDKMPMDKMPKEEMKLKDVPAPPPCYTIQVGIFSCISLVIPFFGHFSHACA